MQLNKVDVIGGGPSGLYTAILLKTRMPRCNVTVFERNAADATFGFGVVFSDQALDFLKADDPDTHNLITPRMERWRNIELMHRREKITLDSIGFSAIGRLQLLKLLQQRAQETGVHIVFEHEIASPDELSADLIVGADGINSLVRSSDPQTFGQSLDQCNNHFAWFGTNKPFDVLTQTFVETEQGCVNAHHYRYEKGMSTFIVECDADSFYKLGFDQLNERESARKCEQIFADTLDGHELLINHSYWRQFPKLWCEKWHHGNRVLLGDAVHTAHFSIGSGTRLAMEEALALVNSLTHSDTLGEALEEYELIRKPISRKIVEAANTSSLWYDQFAEKMKLDPLEFAYDYLMRSGRIDHERLKKTSPQFMAQYDQARGVC